jgi:hypothetical protein
MVSKPFIIYWLLKPDDSLEASTYVPRPFGAAPEGEVETRGGKAGRGWVDDSGCVGVGKAEAVEGVWIVVIRRVSHQGMLGDDDPVVERDVGAIGESEWRDYLSWHCH